MADGDRADVTHENGGPPDTEQVDEPHKGDVAGVADVADVRDVADVADVAHRVLASRKYRRLDRGFVERISAEAWRRTADPGQAAKDAKRRLHQAYGAFLQGEPATAVRQALRQMRDAGVPPKDALRRAMRAHASTAERVPHLDEFAALLATWCPRPTSVVDLACGLGPLSVPWLSLAPDASYWCCDIDTELVAALAELDTELPVRLHAESRDVVADPPSLAADLGLLLKTVTTLEQQRRGRSTTVLAGLRCRHVVVSLPRRSLGGRRGYTRDPLDEATRLVAGTPYELLDDAPLGTEHLVHLLRPGDDLANRVAAAADDAHAGGGSAP